MKHLIIVSDGPHLKQIIQALNEMPDVIVDLVVTNESAEQLMETYESTGPHRRIQSNVKGQSSDEINDFHTRARKTFSNI